MLHSQIIAGILALFAFTINAGVADANVLNSCTTYCHGLPPRDGLRKANPHFDSQSSAFSGNHRTHLPAVPVAASCSVCHGPVSPTDFGHQNGVINMANSLKGYSSASIRAKYDLGLFFNQTSIPNLAIATCSNVSCHFETKSPAWNTSPLIYPAGCSVCHGAPPSGGTTGTAGSHVRHDAYFPGETGCQKCHPAYTTFSHASSAGRSLRVQGYLRDPANNLEPAGTYSGSGTNYFPSQSAAQLFGSCSTIYCHSSGQGATGTGTLTYQSVTWGGAALNCGSCHQNMATASTTTGSHQLHATATTSANGAGVNYTCQVCHGLSYSRSKVPAGLGGSHVNKNIELSFTTISGGVGAGATYSKGSSFSSGSAYGQCSTSACHGSGRPVWGGNTTRPECFKCHGSTVALFTNVSAASVAPGFNGEGRDTGGNTVATSPRVGAHQTHLTAADNISNPIRCGECHTTHLTVKDATHLNFTTATITFGPLARNASHAPTVVRTSGIINCSNTYCHTGNRTGATAASTTPAFASASLIGNTSITDTCINKCHGLPPGGGVAGDTHAGRLASGSYTTPASLSACSSQTGGTGCHPTLNSAPTSMANIFFDKTKHINGAVEAAGGHTFPYPGATHSFDASPITACTGCHTNTGATGYPVLAGVKPDCRSCHTLASPGTGCISCHGSTADGKPSGALGAFPNYSGSHTKHVVGQGMACSECHFSYGTGTANHGSSNRLAHNDVTFVGLSSPSGKFHATKTATTASCVNIACHGDATWGVTKFNCVTCHAAAIGSRVAVTGEFASQSHHVQGAELPLTPVHCAKCHWEANADGTVNATYHRGVQNANAGVSLIVWTGTSRPVSPTSATLISYTANGARDQIAKLNSVCLGCHSVYNAAIAPFGTYRTDVYAPEQRLKGRSAADNSSIQARYSTTRTVAWSNYLFNNNSGNIVQYGTNMKSKLSKALSAHGNASKNQMPAWNGSAGGTGEDKTMADYTYTGTSGKRNVFCFDCHNSHGSSATGITSSYSSATGGSNSLGGKGGLLKTTVAGKRGYTVNYTPAQRTITYSNVSGIGQTVKTTTSAVFNPGAAICNDCHNNNDAAKGINISKPWSITGTFSSSRAIVGYWSTPYFDNYTFNSAKRTAYKAGGAVGAINDRRKPMGGHYGSSVSTRSAQHDANINGLCTPCHDPHGVSPLLGAERSRGVPLLKGTWVTSPYLEDKAGKLVKRGGGSKFAGIGSGGAAPGYHIDQNTFLTAASAAYVINGGAAGPATSATARSNKRSQHFRSFNVLSSAKTLTGYPGAGGLTAAQFAGLCNECHTQANLTNTAAPSASNWQSKERVHQSVLGWAATTGSNANNQLHSYTCAKCHAPHVSRLPRLLVTNCLDQRHFGQSVSSSIASTGALTTTPGNIIQSTLTSSALGAGRFPGGGSRYSNTPGSAQNSGGWWFQTNGGAAGAGTQPNNTPAYGSLCHNATNASGSTTYSPIQQKWNKKSQW